MIWRSNCEICYSADIVPKYTTKPLPIHMGVTTQPYSDDVFQKQEWGQCSRCGCVQLIYLFKPEELYSNGHNPGTVGSTWSKHHEEFSKFVSLWAGQNICEVGAGTDALAALVHTYRRPDSYTIVGPGAKQLHPHVPTSVVAELFGPLTKLTNPNIDTFVHSHTMEHFYNAHFTIWNMRNHLPLGGRMIISVPLTSEALFFGHHNALNFEHTYTTTVRNIEACLGMNGFAIKDFKYFNTTNVFICAEVVDGLDVELLNESADIDACFRSYSTKLVAEYEEKLRILKSAPHKPTFIFGAHAFSQIPLIEYPDIQPYITAILDNDPTKQGKRLYGIEGITVCSPEILRGIRNPRVIVDAAQYTDEIIAGLLKINPLTEIL